MPSRRPKAPAGATRRLSTTTHSTISIVTAWTRWLNATGSAFKVAEFKPKAGDFCKKSSTPTAAAFSVILKHIVDGKIVVAYDSGPRGHNTLIYCKLPAGVWCELHVSKSAASPAGYIRPRIVKIDDAGYLAATT